MLQWIFKTVGLLGMLLLTGVRSTSVAASDAPLADAAEVQDWEEVEKLLNQAVDVNQAQVDGMTALHWATYHDHLATVQKLIAAGTNVAAGNRYGVTALSLACTNGNGIIVERLLEFGADPSTSLRGGETVLMTAARTGDLRSVKALLSRGADPQSQERQGQTAIMWGAAEGHADVVQTLIDAGGDFRRSLPSGFTPLLFAVREGRQEVVRTLLNAGADVNEPSQPGGKTGGKALPAGTSPLLLAVENGHFELARFLLDAGADPNDQRSGYTALHTLSWVRKPNRGDGDDGDPAPIGSGNVSSLQLVRELVRHGANVNERLKKGRSGRGILNRVGATPLMLAAVTADASYVRLLVELGADPKLANADHATPLLAAAGVGTLAPGEEAGTEDEVLETVALLMDLGADINAVDDNGETALHGAAYKSLPRVVAWLAAKGAKPEIWNKKNKYGWTPLAIAEGYRVGNFKPAPETLAALHQALRDAGITPPPSAPSAKPE